MITNHKKRIFDSISIPLVILGCLQDFLSSEIVSIAAIFLIALSVVMNEFKFTVKRSYPLLILCIILIVGAISGLENVGTRAYIRDLYYYLNPIIFIYIGMIFSNKKEGIDKILNTIIVISFILSVFDIGRILVKYTLGASLQNFRQYIQVVMVGDVISIGALLVKWDNKINGLLKHKKTIFLLLCLVEIVGTSRTIWLETLVIVLSVLFLGRNKSKAFVRVLGITLAIVMITFIAIPFIPQRQIDRIRFKVSNSLNEISSKEEWTPKTIGENWRGYEVYCAKNQFVNEGIVEQLFGGGFGTGIKVGSYASYMKQTGDCIYVIHNGFFCVLIKEGLLGLLLYITFFVVLLVKSLRSVLKTHSKIDSLAVGVTLCMIIFTLLVKGLFADFAQLNALLFIGAWLNSKSRLEYIDNER